MSKNDRAKIWSEFEKMRIKHPRLDDVRRAFDDLREVKRQNPLSPQRFVSIFAPTHSGKSMAVRLYIENTVVNEAIARGLFSADRDRALIAREQKLVLHVSLEGITRPKSLATDILTALGDKDAARGTASVLLQRSYDMMRDCGTELLVVDEIQHLSPTAKERQREKSLRDQQDQATSVTNTLKTMMIRGLVPMVFIGIEEGRHHLFNDKQLSDRCREEIDFGRLDYAVKQDRKMFDDWCGRIGLKLQQHGLFENPSNFLEGDIPGCLYEISGGVIGIVSRIAEQAAVIATSEKAPAVTREHLAEAFDKMPKGPNSLDYNPFRDGVRGLKKRAG